jgi:UDP-N-acetylglucosamine--N-acetylmuramyl-(pentapeptide) pyrophosphoryl-undecaprenol N-acetylglucosamine transferase
VVRCPRILFYAVNGLGLGHVSRLLAIGRRVRSLLPEAEIVYFTSSEAEDVIYREGFAAFKVPSKSLRAQAGLRPGTYSRMLQTVTLNLMASFHPHVLVVDTFPAGAMQELLPVLRWDSRRVFVFRAQRMEAARTALMQNTLALYDLAIVPHSPGEEEAPVPDGLETEWTGPILLREADEALPRAEARALLGLPDQGPVVYVSFGGGGDKDMDAALQQAVGALAGGAAHVAVAAAPLYRGAAPRQAGVTPVRYYPMADLYGAFDAAISAAGYNTTMELLHHGVPTALYPFARQVDDQEARADRLAGAGAALRLKSLEAAEVAEAVGTLLDPTVAARLREAGPRAVPGGGAALAAQRIVDLCR